MIIKYNRVHSLGTTGSLNKLHRNQSSGCSIPLKNVDVLVDEWHSCEIEKVHPLESMNELNKLPNYVHKSHAVWPQQAERCKFSWA